MMSTENRYLSSVHMVTRALASVADGDQALRVTLEAAIQGVDATGGSVYLHDPETHKLWFRHALGTDSEGNLISAGLGLYGESILDNEGIAGQVFQTHAPLISNDIPVDPQHAKRIDESFQYETHNLATVPIQFPGGTTIGVMQLVNKREGDFTDDDLIVLDILASIAAMAASNADLTRKTCQCADPEDVADRTSDGNE